MRGGDRRLLAALLLLLAAAEVARCVSDAINCIKGIKGEDITLSPNVTGRLSEIIWKKEVNKKFDKVAEWEVDLKLYSNLLNRADIDPTSGNLTIQTIKQIDDGKYKAEALVGLSYQLTDLCLKTLEPPSAPNLTCNIDDDYIYANCASVTGYELPLSFHWSGMNNITIVNRTEGHSIVKLPKNTDHSRNITCTIAASKSHVSTTISLMACDSRGAVSQERTNIITAILIIPFILILFGAFILWKIGICRRLRGKGNHENQCAQLSEDIRERHQGEMEHFLERPPENEPSREVHLENHTNESGPGDEQRPEPEPEPKRTSSTEVPSEKSEDECNPFIEAGPELETVKTSSTDAILMPTNEAGLELQTMKASSAEGVTTPES